MQAIAGGRSRAPVAAWATLVAILSCSSLVLLRHPTSRLGLAGGVLGCLVALVALNQRRILSWRSVVSAIILALIFIPIRRYDFRSGLPFNLEIYRILLFAAAGLWVTALLIDPRVRFRKSLMDVPLATLALVYLTSIAVSGSRLDQPGLGSAAIKQYSVFMSLLLVYFLITSVARTFEDVEAILRVLVGGGAVVAFFSLIESRTHWNAFNHLGTLFPFLRLTDQLSATDLARGGHLRVLGSAQHPIALSAFLVMLVPLAGYLAARTRKGRWWFATFLLLAAAVGTLSRTGIVMLGVTLVVLVVLRPRDMRQLFGRTKYLILPLLLAVHLALPGTLGTLKDLFFANGGVIAQQQGGQVGSGRVASFGPGMTVIGQHPVLGLGYGTRITDDADPYKNSFITDDGWLSTGMEAGIAAVLAWLWIFLSFLIRLGAAARKDHTPRGNLLAACAASVTAFGFGMATYDALTFLQVTFLLFIVLALGSVAFRVSVPRSQFASAPERHPS